MDNAIAGRVARLCARQRESWGDMQRTTPLSAGVNACVLKLVTSARVLVLRVFLQPHAASDTPAEVMTQRLAAAAGIAPPVVLWDPSEQVLVMEWLDAPPWTVAQLQTVEGLSQCAHTFKVLHQLPLPSQCLLPPFDWQSQFAHYASAPAVRAHPLGRAVFQRVAQLLPLKSPRDVCLVHHDPIIDNLLGQSPVQLIDWEYAGLNDPLFDLVALARYHALTDAQAEALLSGYGFAGDWAEFTHLGQLFDALHWLWCVANQRFASFNPAQRDEFERAVSSAG